ncbi:MAG: hypothetical protein ACP5N2_02830 [Candidatus Nanoarchaeia archaeon]
MNRELNYKNMAEITVVKGKYDIVHESEALQGSENQRRIISAKQISEPFAPLSSYTSLRDEQFDSSRVKFIGNGKELLKRAPLEDIAYIVLTPKLVESKPELSPVIGLYLINY